MQLHRELRSKSWWLEPQATAATEFTGSTNKGIVKQHPVGVQLPKEIVLPHSLNQNFNEAAGILNGFSADVKQKSVAFQSLERLRES